MRERKIVLIVGSQGSGKTTLAKALYGAAMQRRQRVSIIDPNHNLGGWFRADEEDLHADLWTKLNTRSLDLLVCDDADRYVGKAQKKGSPWTAIALTNRHLAVDVILTARRVQNLPDSLLSGVDFLYVFQCSQADRNGIKRLQEIAPGLEVPTKPYEFVCIQPKTATGEPIKGRTLASGGFSLEIGDDGANDDEEGEDESVAEDA